MCLTAEARGGGRGEVVARAVPVEMSGQFVLVRWLIDECVGVMPISAAQKGSDVSPGTIVKMKWSGKTFYDAEILSMGRVSEFGKHNLLGYRPSGC